MKTANKVTGLFLALALALAWGQTPAQSYPNKRMRMVIPFTTGGGNDIVGRIVAAKMSEGLGQPVVVENRPGAQGAIAVENVLKAPPDGHSMLMGPSGTMTINPAIYSKLPYATLRDFAPVTMVGTYSLILIVNPSLPVRTTRELIEYAKARPTQVNYGSTSGLFQLASELFNQRAGTRFQHIPYKGAGDMLTAVLSGELTMVLGDPVSAAGALARLQRSTSSGRGVVGRRFRRRTSSRNAFLVIRHSQPSKLPGWYEARPRRTRRSTSWTRSAASSELPVSR